MHTPQMLPGPPFVFKERRASILVLHTYMKLVNTVIMVNHNEPKQVKSRLKRIIKK